jgi:phosphodiesterase/alkaline phosphatase D-like protein
VRTAFGAVVLFSSMCGLAHGQPALAPAFAIAAGDMTDHDAVLWAQLDPAEAPADLIAEVSADPGFTQVAWHGTGRAVAADGNTLKLDATGLSSGTTYYYRFSTGGAVSPIGRFTTNPAADQPAPFKLGFTGDADGRFRPYPSMAGFGTLANPGSLGLDAFIFLGDCMYETASKGSPAVPDLTSASTPVQSAAALAAYNGKYLENVTGVDTATGAIDRIHGQQGLRDLFASVGLYTILDNHELGNKQLQSGGAPVDAASPNANPAFDVNTTGRFNNQTVAFQTLEKSFFNTHPAAADIDGTPETGLSLRNLQLATATVQSPDDPRSNGTVQNYFARRWGRNIVYLQLDDRSYRDVRLDTIDRDNVNGDKRADDRRRTMLGATQLGWLHEQLLAVKSSGAIWTVIAVSTPVDQTGGNQDSKSWFGNYRAERNQILRWIADIGLPHVVFLTTDDHEIRTTRLQYEPDPDAHPGIFQELPGAFEVLTGPLGAGGPDQVTDHRIDNIRHMLDTPSTVVDNNPDLVARADPAIGLVGFPGLADVYRDGDPNAATSPSSIDFYATDKFCYTTLAWDAHGNLRVETWGIDSYKENTYPQTAPTPSLIMAFTVRVE